MTKTIKLRCTALVLAIAAFSAQAQIATGPGASTNVPSGIAVGEFAYANGTATGFFATQPWAGPVAIGSAASANGFGSVTLGAQSFSDAGGVALGAYSVAGAGEVSVGSASFGGLTRRITNVSSGVDQNDVVTVGQLQTSLAGLSGGGTTDIIARDIASLASMQAESAGQVAGEALTRVGVLDGRVTSLESRVRGLERDIDAAAATGAAMANAQMPSLAPGERAAVAGVGYSSGESALAVGVVGSNYAGQVFGLRLSVATNGKTTVGAGVGFKF